VAFQALREEAAGEADCVVIVIDHDPALVERAPLIVDTRNALKSIRFAKIVRLWP